MRIVHSDCAQISLDKVVKASFEYVDGDFKILIDKAHLFFYGKIVSFKSGAFSHNLKEV